MTLQPLDKTKSLGGGLLNLCRICDNDVDIEEVKKLEEKYLVELYAAQQGYGAVVVSNANMKNMKERKQ